MKNTVENNVLIAEFMGYRYIEGINAWLLGTVQRFHNFPTAEASPLDSDYAIVRELRYDSSWEWLMPVVEKIQKELYVVTVVHNLAGTSVQVLPNWDDAKVISKGWDDTTNSKNAYYKAVVQFIKWYNEKK